MIKNIVVKGAREHNLKNIDVEIPRDKLVVVTGVSGSGKSSLVNEVLFKRLGAELMRMKVRPGKCDRIEGIVTDGDIRRAMERLKGDFFNIHARDIATPHPKTIGANEKLIEAERVMTRNKITSLLVTDGDGKLAGVIQIYDIKL